MISAVKRKNKVYMGLFLKSIWNKSAYLRRNSAKTLRFSLGHVRQVQSLAKPAVFFSCSHLRLIYNNPITLQ